MKYTNKMVLVPEKMALHTNSNDTKNVGLSKEIDDFKAEMMRILSDKLLSPEVQNQLYTQLFSRFLKLEEENRKPPVIMLKTDDSSDKPDNSEELVPSNNSNTKEKLDLKPQVNPWFKKQMLYGLPKGKIKKAELLIDLLKNSAIFNVNNKGEVLVNDIIVLNS